jgi:hypothetical protein
MRGWVVASAVFAALVVLYNVCSLVLLLIAALASAYSDRLPSGVALGHSAGPFPWGALIAQYGLGLVAVAFLVYVFWRRRRT